MLRTLVAAALAISALAQPTVAAASSSIDVVVDPSGSYSVRFHAPDMTFGGQLPSAPTAVRSSDGTDAVGANHRVEFDYSGRTSAITAYPDLGAVIFSTTYTASNLAAGAFPILKTQPTLPFKLSFQDVPFSPYQMNTLDNAQDGPWLFFDAQANGYLLSPASDFPIARLSADGSSSLGADLSGSQQPLIHTTVLVAGNGLNHLFEQWGATLLRLHAKTPPPNDADLTLKTFGYWTDNGASYYYHFEPQLGYAGTLLAVRQELQQRGIPLGYLQLDSWWYPKGPNARWDDLNDGIFRYRAAPDLFPDGLASFQQQVGLPLVTHARWIDPSSPLRSELAFSGNVMTDPRYWSDVMSYLHSSGVVTYEQDWLGAQAQPVYDLSAPQQFMGNMAADASQDGLTLQYCMPLPRHVMQTVEYGDVTSMRVSDDRFDRNHWDTFLYTSRLASALGVWPWSDVFMSTERNNLVLSLLSGGVLGVGDAMGAENVDNLHHVMRSDAVLIKPDAALVPTDESMLAEAAQGPHTPMVAWNFSDHDNGQLRALYVFAYTRGASAQTASFTPASLGLSGPAYVLDYFAGTGQVVPAGQTFSASVGDGSYFLVAPVGASGIAFLGDTGAYASLGRQRVSALSDDGAVHATIDFASGETSVTLSAYAPSVPTASVEGGTLDPPTYDAASGQFTVAVHPDTTPSSVILTLHS
jgi:hypothetical protein